MDKSILKDAIASIRKELRDRHGKKLGAADDKPDEGSPEEEDAETPDEEAAEGDAEEPPTELHKHVAQAAAKAILGGKH